MQDMNDGNEGIPILRVNGANRANDGDEGEGNPQRRRAVLLDRPSLLYEARGQRRMSIYGETDDLYGSGMTPVDNVDGCKAPGRGGGRGGGGPFGCGGGGGGDPDPGDHIDPKLTFASVGGLPEHVSYLRRAIIYPLANKNAFKEWGMEPPKGILFHGPPGTGKTLLAKAMANEIKNALGGVNLTFFYQKGCESNGMYFGESEENLRELFRQAIQNKPSVIFFDEIDGLCPDRDKSSQSSEAYVGVVTALLGLIDSVKRGEVFLIGATNRLDGVDAAVRRPGRFDKDLPFQLPDIEGRRTILAIHTRNWFKDAPDEDFRSELASKTIGYSGADIEKLCKETLAAARTRCGSVPAAQITITPADWTKALEGMNPSRSDVFGSTIISPKPPLSLMLPLAKSVINEIALKFQILLPNAEGVYSVPRVGMRSFLVWEQEMVSEIYLNHVIMNGVLSHEIVSKIPIFALDMAHFAERVNSGSTPVKAAGDIIGQAATSAKPCILYVPGINFLNDEIARFTKEKTNFVFVRQLQALAGSQATLIATCIGNLQDIAPEIKTLFTNLTYCPVRKPDNEERKAFFHQIFANLIIEEGNDSGEPKVAKSSSSSDSNGGSSGLQPEMSTKFEKNLQVAVDLTINDPCDYLLKLYETLRKEKITQTEVDGDGNLSGYKYETLHQNFVEILDLYSQTKLQ